MQSSDGKSRNWGQNWGLPRAAACRASSHMGSDYSFADYNSNKPLSFKQHFEFHPSGQILLKTIKVFVSEIIVGEIIVKTPYEDSQGAVIIAPLRAVPIAQWLRIGPQMSEGLGLESH